MDFLYNLLQLFFQEQDNTFMYTVCNQILYHNTNYTNELFDEYCQIWFKESLLHCTNILMESTSPFRNFIHYPVTAFNFIWSNFFSNAESITELSKQITFFQPNFLVKADCNEFLNEIAQDYINIAPKYSKNLYYTNYMNIAGSICMFMAILIVFFKTIKSFCNKHTRARNSFKHWEEEQKYLGKVFYEKKINAIVNNELKRSIYVYHHLKAPIISKLHFNKANIKLQIPKSKLKDGFTVLFKSLPISPNNMEEQILKKYSENTIYKHIDGSKKCKFVIELDVDLTDDYIERDGFEVLELISNRTSSVSSETILRVKSTQTEDSRLQLTASDDQENVSSSSQNVFLNLSEENSLYFSNSSECSQPQVWIADETIPKLEFLFEPEFDEIRQPFTKKLESISEQIIQHAESCDDFFHQYQKFRRWSEHGRLISTYYAFVEQHDSTVLNEYVEKHISPLISKTEKRKKCLTYKFRRFQQRIIAKIDNISNKNSEKSTEILKPKIIDSTNSMDKKMRTLYVANKGNNIKKAFSNSYIDKCSSLRKKNNLESASSASCIQKTQCDRRRNHTQKNRQWIP